jgi:hypothetical protein
MLSQVPPVVRRYFELDPYRDIELFVALFSEDAMVVDEGETRRGTAPGSLPGDGSADR